VLADVASGNLAVCGCCQTERPGALRSHTTAMAALGIADASSNKERAHFPLDPLNDAAAAGVDRGLWILAKGAEHVEHRVAGREIHKVMIARRFIIIAARDERSEGSGRLQRKR
jgi:hypothetical protein